MKEFKGTPALDAGLISSAQAVEHYEITRYGTLRRWAEMLGRRNAAALLDRTLKEESQTDELLSQIAEEANRSAEGGRRTVAKKAGSRGGASRRGKGAGRGGKASGAAGGEGPTPAGQ
jgi:hypothetical protein